MIACLRPTRRCHCALNPDQSPLTGQTDVFCSAVEASAQAVVKGVTNGSSNPLLAKVPNKVRSARSAPELG